MHMRDTSRQLANLIFLPLGVFMNLVYPTLRGTNFSSFVGGRDPAFSASDYAFAIWVVIFLGHLVYAVYQALPGQRENATLRRVGWWTAANGLANCGIGYLFTVTPSAPTELLGWLLIVTLLIVLVPVEAGFGRGERQGRDFWLVRVPFSINLGWISLATIIDTAQVLQNNVGWNGAPLAPQAWAALLIVVAAALGVMMLMLRGNIAFAAVVVWGLVGVATKHAGVPVVALPAVAMAVLVAVAVLAAIILRRGRQSFAA